MATVFPADVIEAVTHHMNTDHADDGLMIVRAFAHRGADSVVMTGLDGEGGDWTATVNGANLVARVPWPAPISQRPEIRPAVVALYQKACSVLGVPAKEPHETR